jgi:hypothetical protein
MGDPAYRGTMLKVVSQRVEQDPSLDAAVTEAAGKAEITRMRQASRLAWLPADPFDRLKQAHFEHVGQDAYVDFWRGYMTGVAENPLFRSLLDGGKRIFGNSPAGVLKWMPKGWALSTRGCGSFTTEFGECEATLVLHGAPPSSRVQSTGQTSRGTILGLFDLLSIDGEVEVDDTKMSDGHFEMHARWSEQ